jgi:hypothetical protein
LRDNAMISGRWQSLPRPSPPPRPQR